MDKNLRLRLIMDAAGGAAKFLRGVRGEADSAGKALKTARERLGELKASARKVEDFKRLDAELGVTRDKLAAAQKEAQRLGRAHAATASPTRQMSRALEVAATKVNELEARERSQVQALQAVRGQLDKAGISTRRLAGHEMRLKREISEANDALDQQRKRLEAVGERQRRMGAARNQRDRTMAVAGQAQSAGVSAIAGGAAVAAPLVLASREAMRFEDAMADVRKVVDFPTPASFAAMSNDILALSGRLPVAKEELASIMATAARAGVPRQQLLGFTEQAAKMAVAFDVSSDEAANMMSTWRTAFGLQGDGVAQLSNQVNALTNAYGGNAASVAEMITRVGPLADVAGASSGVLAALSQVMNSVGVESEVGATGIKNLLLGMTKGEAATKSQSAAFRALGLDASTMAGRMQTDAEGAVMAVLEAVAKLPKDKQLSTLGQLFGTESVAAISPMLSQLELVHRNFRAVGDAQFYAGSMDKEFSERARTTSNALQLMRNNASATAVEIGTGLLPAIRAGSKMLGGAAIAVRDFTKAHPGAAKAIAFVVAGIAAALFVFGGLALAVSAVLMPFALLQFAMTSVGVLMSGPVVAGFLSAAGAAWTAAAGFLAAAWPILAIIAVVALVAGAAYLIFKHWKPISAWFAKLWSGIVKGVSTAFAAIGDAVLKYTPLGAIVRNWGAITGFFGSLWTLIQETVGLGLDALTLLILKFTPLGLIVRNWSAITGWLANFWAGLKAAIGAGVSAALALFYRFTPLGIVISNWSGITGWISTFWSGLRGRVGAGISAILTAIRNFKPLNDFKAAFDEVWTWFAGLPARFLQLGTNAMQGLIRGIRGQRAAVQAETGRVANGMVQTTRTAHDTHSPSRVFADLGRFAMQGMALGISQGAGLPLARMNAAAAALVAAGSVSAMPAVALAEAGGGRAAGLPGARPPAVSFDSGPRIAGRPRSPAASSGPAPIINLTVNAAQGMDETRLADLVAQKVAEALAQLRAPDLATYDDDAEGFD